MNSFVVTTEEFSGPVDVLLQMIEKRKLPINDISLAEITDDYIRFVQGMDEQSMSDTTHFILIAATLTLIKSKSLLPTLDLTTEEEGDISELKRRLEILQTFQDASNYIKSDFKLKQQSFYPRTPKREVSFSPHETLTKQALEEALLSVLKEAPEKLETKKEGYVKVAVHIEEMMESLEERITELMQTDFQTFIGSKIKPGSDTKVVRVYQVVGFLAMLELVKNGALSVLQKKNFSKIEIGQV